MEQVVTLSFSVLSCRLYWNSLNVPRIEKIKWWHWKNISKRMFLKHQKLGGCAPGGCITIIIKRDGGAVYQKTCDPLIFIPSPLRNICKQLVPTGITPTILLWILNAQYYTYDLSNVNQMANNMNPCWEDRPGHSLPPDTCKRNNRIDMHINSRQARLSLPALTLWHHTCTSKI